MKKSSVSPQRSSDAAISFKGYRFPLDIISYAVWLYYRFPLSLRMVEEMLAARGIDDPRDGTMLGDEVRSGHRRAYSSEVCGARRQMAS